MASCSGCYCMIIGINSIYPINCNRVWLGLNYTVHSPLFSPEISIGLNRTIVEYEFRYTIFPILRFSDARSKRFSDYTILPIIKLYDSSDSIPIIQFITISSFFHVFEGLLFLIIREIASALIYTMTKNKPYTPSEVWPPCVCVLCSSKKLLAG